MKTINCTNSELKEMSSGFGSQLTNKTSNSFFGHRLKLLRKKEGLSQKAMARKLGIATSTYQRYEDGNLPKGDHLLRICNVFNCSADWLLLGIELTKQNENTKKIPDKEGKQALGSSAPINTDLLTQILEGIDVALNDMGLELAPDKKAELTTLLYEHFEATGVKKETIKRFLRLVA